MLVRHLFDWKQVARATDVWALLGSGGAMWTILSWASASITPLAQYGWGAYVLVGFGATCLGLFALSATLIAWRLSRPLPIARLPENDPAIPKAKSAEEPHETKAFRLDLQKFVRADLKSVFDTFSAVIFDMFSAPHSQVGGEFRFWLDKAFGFGLQRTFNELMEITKTDGYDIGKAKTITLAFLQQYSQSEKMIMAACKILHANPNEQFLLEWMDADARARFSCRALGTQPTGAEFVGAEHVFAHKGQCAAFLRATSPPAASPPSPEPPASPPGR